MHTRIHTYIINTQNIRFVYFSNYCLLTVYIHIYTHYIYYIHMSLCTHIYFQKRSKTNKNPYHSNQYKRNGGRDANTKPTETTPRTKSKVNSSLHVKNKTDNSKNKARQKYISRNDDLGDKPLTSSNTQSKTHESKPSIITT